MICVQANWNTPIIHSQPVDVPSEASFAFSAITAIERLPSEPIGTTTIEITALDDVTGLPIQYARLWVGKQSDKSQILIGETNSSGVFQQTVDYYGVTEITGWMRQMDLTGTDYTPKEFSGVLTAQGFNTIIRLSPTQ